MKKLFILLLLLGVAGSALAASIEWLSTNTDTDWFKPSNWSLGAVPTASDSLVLSQSSGAVPGPVILSGQNAVASGIVVCGIDGSPYPVAQTLTVQSGATLTLASTSAYVFVSGNDGTRRWGDLINAGTINIGKDFSIGAGKSGTLSDVRGWLHMTGGAINVVGTFNIARWPDASGFVELYGGTIDTAYFNMLLNGGTGTVLLDIKNDGKLTFNGSNVTKIAGYVANDWIKGYGLASNVRWDATTTPGHVTVWAVPEPATLCLLGIGALSLIRRK